MGGIREEVPTPRSRSGRLGSGLITTNTSGKPTTSSTPTPTTTTTRTTSTGQQHFPKCHVIPIHFQMIKRSCSRHTWENCSYKMSDLSSQPNLNKNIKDSYFNLSSDVDKSQNLELFFCKGKERLRVKWIENELIHEWEWELNHFQFMNGNGN